MLRLQLYYILSEVNMFGIDDAISSVSNLASTVVDKIYPDATEIEKIKLNALAAEMDNQYKLVLGQLEINKEEAQHSSFFVAGARPAALWVGVISLFYAGVGLSMLNWVTSVVHLPPFPMLSDTASEGILYGLLGLGGLRSVDKFKGVDTKKVSKQGLL